MRDLAATIRRRTGAAPTITTDTRAGHVTATSRSLLDALQMAGEVLAGRPWGTGHDEQYAEPAASQDEIRYRMEEHT